MTYKKTAQGEEVFYIHGWLLGSDVRKFIQANPEYIVGTELRINNRI
jgi:hypothetical protein